jgi:hypothetical protein
MQLTLPSASGSNATHWNPIHTVMDITSMYKGNMKWCDQFATGFGPKLAVGHETE